MTQQEALDRLSHLTAEDEEYHYLLGYLDGLYARELLKDDKAYTHKVRSFMQEKREELAREAPEYMGRVTLKHLQKRS